VTGVRTQGLGRVFQTGKGLRRRGHRVVALDGVSLDVEPGELHGLLGPNGAGKTTLVKILSTVLLPSSGRAWVHGHDVVADAGAVRRLVGIVLGGERGLYTRLTARQNLRYWAALHRLPDAVGRARADALLERLGLGSRADERVETYSRGMKQRLHLARGLVSDPPVLFLDEPSVGLDPVGARELRTLVRQLHGDGRTIVLTTHDMVEAEQLCDRVTLVDRGRVLATESPAGLAALLSRYERIDVRGAAPDLVEELRRIPGVAGVGAGGDAAGTGDGASVRITVADAAATSVVLGRLVAAGITSINTSHPSLEEVYVHVVGDRGLEV
jgi:ABC-2 type transport system ATP-binding protein